MISTTGTELGGTGAYFLKAAVPAFAGAHATRHTRPLPISILRRPFRRPDLRTFWVAFGNGGKFLQNFFDLGCADALDKSPEDFVGLWFSG